MKKMIVGLLSLGIIIAAALYTAKVVKEMKSMANEMNYENGIESHWTFKDFIKNKDLKVGYD